MEPAHVVTQVGWEQILNNWRFVETDLHERFGIDCESGILRQRTWRWLKLRINDLIDQQSRLRTALGLTTETRS